eukprot:gi/632949905/ref/XP_007890417.1/ PREDICTED: uncharacterized protein LOC103177859 [Callorhinchus milii]
MVISKPARLAGDLPLEKERKAKGKSGSRTDRGARGRQWNCGSSSSSQRDGIGTPPRNAQPLKTRRRLEPTRATPSSTETEGLQPGAAAAAAAAAAETQPSWSLRNSGIKRGGTEPTRGGAGEIAERGDRYCFLLLLLLPSRSFPLSRLVKEWISRLSCLSDLERERQRERQREGGEGDKTVSRVLSYHLSQYIYIKKTGKSVSYNVPPEGALALSALLASSGKKNRGIQNIMF